MRSLLVTVAISAILVAEPPAVRKIAAVRVFGNPGQVGLFVACAYCKSDLWLVCVINAFLTQSNQQLCGQAAER